MATIAPARAGGKLWRHRAFMLFWSGETVSLFGTQITMLALPLTAVLTLQATASQLGWIRFAEALPFVLFTLVFGAWVDRRRRKPALILANASRAVLIGLVPLLAVLGLLRLPLLAAIAFGMGVFAVLFDVTWLAYVPTLVRTDDLVEANGKASTSAASAEVAGPGIGGVLVQTLTAPLALLADALSYVVATITLLAIRAPEPAPRAQANRRLLLEIREGAQVVWRNPSLRAITFMSGLWNMLFGVADTLFVFYAVRQLGIGAGALGGVFAVGAVGGLIGSAISTRLGQRGRFGPVLGVAFTCGTLPWLLLPSVTGPRSLEIAGFTLAYFIVRLGLGLWGVLVLSYRQAVTPNHLQGRVGASMRFVSYGLGALGYLLAGILPALTGLRPALWLAALGFVVILLITLLATPLPRLRSIPTASDTDEPAREQREAEPALRNSSGPQAE